MFSKYTRIYKTYGPIGFIKRILCRLGLMHRNVLSIPANMSRDIPIFIISYNRVTCLKLLVDYLCDIGYKDNIIILDNASTYGPLLRYLDNVQVKVVKLKTNYGHLVLWKCGLFKDIIDNKPFVLTDSDILPTEECPKDFMEKFYGILLNDESISKAGFSLKLDDIPDYYKQKGKVISWEQQFWKEEDIVETKDISYYKTTLDTTFALYRPRIHPYELKWFYAARTNMPYTARHLGWYVNTDEDEEVLEYIKTVKDKSSHWYTEDYLE